MAPTPTKETERSCVLCCQEVDIFALGKCDHPVCYRCSTKMRVLCEQKYCAVCREELDKVVFVKQLAAFSSLPHQQFACEKKHDIYFGDEKIHAQYRHLLLSECVRCSEPKVFSRFEELEQHMRKQHELFCCKLCTKHLKIFSHERKWYNRKELARHRAHGDPDDTSHRGHPLCKFCDDRYLDNDELLKHLRRDHYFCHFCDADGSQEYYSDYPYLSEHFRESHYLCEEGRCATEQFTHAFRTEIDYKAHKAGAHSKNRAEARQNRQIDLQFNYAPRQQRRNEGLVGGEDYEEARHNRGGRRGPHGGGGQKSWRYSREEEDRQMEAAMRASLAMRRQEERGAVQERSTPKHCREERAERKELEEPRNRTGLIKPTNKPPVRTMKSTNPGEEDDFPVLGATAVPPIVKSAPAVVPAARAALKEDDFPSLSTAAVPSLMTPAYSAQPKKNSSFHEEDFPALVSKVRPLKPAAGSNSAWSTNTAVAKPNTHPPPSSSRTTPPLSSAPSGPQLLSSSAPASSRRKKKVGENGKASTTRSPPPSDDEKGGKTQQEFRSVPTMLDISSLLTVKGGNSKPSTVTSSSSSHPTPNTDLSTSKANKKKKTQKNAPVSSTSVSSTATTTVNTIAVETAAQKENVPEKNCNKPFSSTVTAALTSGLTNGHPEKSPPARKEAVAVTPHPNMDPLLEQEEEFPALMTKKPPPGFKTSFPIKASAPASSSTMPPPPPGLGLSAPKPPPGFTGIPLNSNVVEDPPPAVNLPPKVSSSGYLVPEDFHQRNLALIQSIRKYLHNDESKFNQFKNYSAQFRQGVISAAQYHRSCKDLLGEDYNSIFNELLVLLPDTIKQQELLTAHADCKALEKQSGAGGGKKNKNKKNAWQTPTAVANVAAELECQVCPTCRQVLAHKDFHSHKTLHTRETEEFPSLQSISRIIS
ncbi:putative zinc finger protein 598 [Scophthalmus maximus]|uniref:RING-type E3 ubiquitin transferase n=1 Tax=Scophthalmus maximus TaxID=52904 RepID=A0A2U9CQ04_SCOMX|nr:E3 ubiquitin-protein ligase ZNF598 [Scophthalmus maximus]AWP18668.1 putative zinc finger protein 598 [Scophthalmus maximus]